MGLDCFSRPGDRFGYLDAEPVLSWFGHVDIIATAQGRIVPSGKVKLVQPLETGIVRAIHVQDGDRVKSGQVLVELDPTTTSAERDKIAHDLIQAQLDTARLLAQKQAAAKGTEPKGFAAPKGAPPHDVEMAEAAMQAQAAEQAAKLAGLDQQIAQKRAEAEEGAATIDKLKATLPVLAQKEALRKQLLDIQYGNRFAYLDAEQALVEAQHDLIMQTHHSVEIEAARVALERQRDQARAEYTHQVLSDLAKAEQQVDDQTQELIKATRKSTETVLTSPIDGVVQQLAIHTVGGVVTPAQQLLVVVPEDGSLVVEAMVPNRDVGFVHEGQEVEVKIETFTFTRYGLIHGRVVGLSHDAVTDDQRKPDRPDERDRTGKGGSDNSGSPSYVARVALNRTSLEVDGEERVLGPGMAVTAEIKTGSRRILSYLLSPLRHYAQDVGRER
jgi:hemolysin D